MGKLGLTELILLVPMLALYFLPTIIAISRKKDSAVAIFLLNFFLGWTFLGWIAALIWACTKNQTSPTIVFNNTSSPRVEPLTNSTKSSYDEKLESLQKLKNLLDSGVLSQEEFDDEKARILEKS